MDKKGTIMVVADNHESLSFLAKLFANEGFGIMPADSGELALNAIKTNYPDLILLDVKLPGIDGFEVCRRLKSDKGVCEIPIIFLTAIKSNKKRLEGLKLGAVDYITKPFNNQELLIRVNTHSNLYKLNQQLKKQTKELMESKKKVEENEKLFRNITENIPAFISSIDNATLKFKFANSKFTAGCKKTKEEIIGAHISEIIGMNKAELAMQYINEARKGNTTSYANTYESPEGKKHINICYVPGYDNNGNVTEIIELRQDVTKQKRYEENLKEINNEIIAQNKEYKQLIEQLTIAKAKAEECDKLKSAFLANMSHEIRTPMNGIIGFARLMESSNLSGVKRKNFSRILSESCEQLLRIVNNLVDISKIESGQISVNKSETCVNQLCVDLYSLYITQAEKRNICLSMHCGLDFDQSTIFTDQTKLRQILENLLSNALKFTKEGKIEFGYNLKNGKLIFYVQDSGKGIPEEQHAKIFERFSQIKGGESSYFPGAGLGLAISKGNVNALGGNIWFESTVGKGTTFYFSLPFHLDSYYNGQTAGKGHNAKKKLNILVVEDNAANLLYLREVLAKINANVLFATCGMEAIEICKKNKSIDLILMDVKLPDINGLEVTKQIKTFREDVPIIAQTAYALTGDEEKAMDAGCSAYLAKPVNSKKLIGCIEEYSKYRNMSEQVASF